LTGPTRVVLVAALMLRSAALGFAFAAGTAACTFSSLDEFSIDNVEAADAELNHSSRLLWSRFEDGNEEAVTELVGRIHLIVEHARAQNDMPLQRRIERLTAADLPAPLKDKVDPGKAVGMMVATDIPCSLAQVERLTIARNQPELYPDVYVTYDRTYVTSDTDYLERKIDRLKWATQLTADLQGEYSSKLDGTIRYVAHASPDAKPVLLVRSFFPEPAVCKKAENRWDQDYQIELYYERSPGSVVHVYALWRDLKLGSLTLETQIATSVQLSGLIDWDVRTGKLCKDGRGGAP
jgi:hypothetical protein